MLAGEPLELVWYLALLLMLGAVCLFMFLGLPVAFAFFTAAFLGSFLFNTDDIGLIDMPAEIQKAVTKFLFTPIALFLLMGEILLHTGVAFKAIGAIDRLIARVPGRLSIVTIAGGTVFSSLSGSSIANTAILGSVLLPDMVKRGYHPTFSMGPIMAVGGIAVLIPPSALAVLLASITEKSISQLLIAGIVPGVMMATMFFAYVIIRCWINPNLAPAYDPDTSHLDNPIVVQINMFGGSKTFTYDKRSTVKRFINRWLPFWTYILPLMMIFVVVVGSIFFKWASPTEAAALGCISATAACYLFRLFNHRIKISGVEGAEFGWREMHKALMETAKITIMILLIIAGSLFFTQSLEISGAAKGLLEALTAWELTQLAALFLMMGVLLFLGAFMDQVSMVLLTLPFFMPLADKLGIDSIYLLVLMLIVMEVSLLTPPFGLLLYVMKGVAPAGTTLGQVVRSALPFVGIKVLILAFLILVPAIAQWLPNQLKDNVTAPPGSGAVIYDDE